MTLVKYGVPMTHKEKVEREKEDIKNKIILTPHTQGKSKSQEKCSKIMYKKDHTVDPFKE